MYRIENTLTILPYISYGIIVIFWIIFEIKERKERLVERALPESGRGDFIPPDKGEGYEYFVPKAGETVLVYINKKKNNLYKVYMVQGTAPNVKMKHDRYGNYFNVHALDGFAVEKIVDQLFS